MKKLFINNRILSNSLTGMQRYLMDVMEGLDAAHFPYQVLTPEKPLNIVRAHLWEQTRLPRLLEKDAILWSPANSGPVSCPNQVVTVHDILHIDRPDLHVNSFLASQFYKWMQPQLLRNAMKIIVVSQYTKQRLAEKLLLNDDKIAVVYEAADSRFHPARQDAIVAVRKKYSIETDRYVLSLGSLDIKKNLRRLIEAWALLRSSSNLTKDVSLVLAGKKIDRLSLKKLGLDKLPEGVMFTGFVADEDLPALYSGASTFVFPSLYEGFGLPPLEAMACGTPVIASNATSLPEVCGSAAVYVDPLDVESIAEGIRTVLDNSLLAEELSKKGLVQAAKFSWERCAREHIQVFEELGE